MTKVHAKMIFSMLQRRNLSLILFVLMGAAAIAGATGLFTSKEHFSHDHFHTFIAPTSERSLERLFAASEQILEDAETKTAIEMKQAIIKPVAAVVEKKKVAPLKVAKKATKKIERTIEVEKSEVEMLATQDTTKHEIASEHEFKQYGFEANSEAAVATNWSSFFESANVAATLKKLSDEESNRAVASNEDEVIEQTVTESVAAVTENEFNNDEEADALNILLKNDEKANGDDDLVLIDYSKNSELGDSPSTETKLDEPVLDLSVAEELIGQSQQADADYSENAETTMSPTVLEAIARNQDQLTAMVDNSFKKKVESPLEALSKMTTQKSSYNFAGDEAGQSEVDGQNSFLAAGTEESDHRLIIQALVGKRGEELTQKAYNYEFIPAFNSTVSLYDNADGEIVVNGSLHSETALLSGSIVKAGYVRTRVEIPVERGYVAQPIALLEQETLLSFLEERNLRGAGGHLFVQLSEQIDDVEIDAGHEEKLFINEKMELTKEILGASYVLFVGVDPGNVTLTYFHGAKSAAKVIGIYEDELFVDTPVLLNSAPAELKLLERNLMGKSATDLLIDGNKMKSFQSGKTAIPLAYNNYEVDHGVRPIGMRNYVEFSHTGAVVLGGHTGHSTVEVPSRDYMENILRVFNVADLRSSCMVQINFSANVASVEFAAEGARGGIDFDSLYLDRDGVFNKDASELATKLFISGYEQGIFYLNVNYQDGSKDIFKSYCSIGTYLFEQL